MPFSNVHPDIEREALAVENEVIGSELINVAKGNGDTIDFTYNYNGEDVTFTVYDLCQLNTRDLAAALVAAATPVEVEEVVEESEDEPDDAETGDREPAQTDDAQPDNENPTPAE